MMYIHPLVLCSGVAVETRVIDTKQNKAKQNKTKQNKQTKATHHHDVCASTCAVQRRRGGDYCHQKQIYIWGRERARQIMVMCVCVCVYVYEGRDPTYDSFH